MSANDSTVLSAAEFMLRQALLGATPLVLAGYGELVAQRAGVINVGIEGLMLMGCIAAYAGAVATQSAAMGVAAAIAVGVLFALLFAIVTIWCRADQIVTGTAINLLALGASTTAWGVLRNSSNNTPPPLFEPIVFGQYWLFFFTLALGVAIWVWLRFTRAGLIVQALGDAPDAANAAGVRVRLWRTLIVLGAGACAGLAGSYLSTMRGHSFQINMTAGAGFLVLALVIFGRWTLPGLVLATLLFGALEGLQAYLSALPNATAHVPHQLFEMLPYAATLIALAALTRSRSGPIYLGRSWPEER